MKTFLITLCLLFTLVGTALPSGLPCTIFGSVTDAYTGEGISNVWVEVSGCIGSAYAYTDSSGNWTCTNIMCDGYYVSFTLLLGSDCYNPIGRTHLFNGDFDTFLYAGESFSYPIDSDGDLLCDVKDNCPDTKNANGYGTCSRGKVGNACFNHRHCGCKGFCSKNQEDSDDNGIGDVCEDMPTIPPLECPVRRKVW